MQDGRLVEKILLEKRLEDSEASFRGHRGVRFSTKPIVVQDEDMHRSTYLVVDVRLSGDGLDEYDIGRKSEGIEGCRSSDMPTRLLYGKSEINPAAGIDLLPNVLDGMSEEEERSHRGG